MHKERNVTATDALSGLQIAALAVVGVLLLAVYWPTMYWLGHRWSLGVWFHTHGWAVPPIAGWLIWMRLKDTDRLPRDASAWGFAFLIPAVLLQVLDALLRFELLSAVSLVLVIPGLSLLFLGRARTRRIWFGLFFLVFAVPIPLFVVRKVHMVLRHIAAVGTENILALGYEVQREGTLLEVGPESIQIADACSGFATLMALTMAGMLLVYLTPSSLRRKLAVIALVFPIAALANVVRCVLLTMLVLAFGTDILHTFLHPLSGVVTFILALGLLQLAMLLIMPKAPKPAEAAA